MAGCLAIEVSSEHELNQAAVMPNTRVSVTLWLRATELQPLERDLAQGETGYLMTAEVHIFN